MKFSIWDGVYRHEQSRTVMAFPGLFTEVYQELARKVREREPRTIGDMLLMRKLLFAQFM
jgi:hypothetical protein